ncbi:MAG: hypothetical protein WBW62_12970, partial [Solirubrobacterales bacterium]
MPLLILNLDLPATFALSFDLTLIEPRQGPFFSSFGQLSRTVALRAAFILTLPETFIRGAIDSAEMSLVRRMAFPFAA